MVYKLLLLRLVLLPCTSNVVVICKVIVIYFSQLGTRHSSETSVGVPHTSSFADVMVQIMVIAFAFQGQGVSQKTECLRAVTHVRISRTSRLGQRNIASSRMISNCRCSQVYPEIQTVMKKPSDFVYSTILASVSLSIVYAATGIFGYDIIGSHTPWLYTCTSLGLILCSPWRTPFLDVSFVSHVRCALRIKPCRG